MTHIKTIQSVLCCVKLGIVLGIWLTSFIRATMVLGEEDSLFEYLFPFCQGTDTQSKIYVTFKTNLKQRNNSQYIHGIYRKKINGKKMELHRTMTKHRYLSNFMNIKNLSLPPLPPLKKKQVCLSGRLTTLE